MSIEEKRRRDGWKRYPKYDRKDAEAWLHIWTGSIEWIAKKRLNRAADSNNEA